MQHPRTLPARRERALGFLLPLVFGTVACGDDARVVSGLRPEAAPDSPANEVETGSGSSGGPVYLYTIAVYAPDDTLQYSVLSNELNFEIGVQDLQSAREFPGYTGITAIEGSVVTGDSETPFASKFQIGEDLSWKTMGQPLNFGDYFTDDADGLNFYFQSIRGSDMYFFYGAERTSRVHWNTDSWRIEGAYQDTVLPTRPGWTLGSTGNRTGVRDFVGPVVQSFTLANDETGLVSDESFLAVYDPETHAERDVITVPCPGLQQATKDEQGNLYFASTFEMPTRALYGRAPKPCVVRLHADGSLDESFPLNDLTAWTGGYYGVNFRYLQRGLAVANVLHHDRLVGVDFSGEVDPVIETKIGGSYTDDGYISEDVTLWELELIDMNAGTSRIVEGFLPEHDVSYYSIFFEVDGRTFISVQFDVQEITHNAMYELDLETATVTPVGEVVGDLAGVERVR